MIILRPPILVEQTTIAILWWEVQLCRDLKYELNNVILYTFSTEISLPSVRYCFTLSYEHLLYNRIKPRNDGRSAQVFKLVRRHWAIFASTTFRVHIFLYFYLSSTLHFLYPVWKKTKQYIDDDRWWSDCVHVFLVRKSPYLHGVYNANPKWKIEKQRNNIQYGLWTNLDQSQLKAKIDSIRSKIINVILMQEILSALF